MPRGLASIYTIVLPSGAQVFTAAKIWLVTCGPWWATSATVHAVAIYGTMWVMGPRPVPVVVGSAPTFETEIEQPIVDEPTVDHFAVGETPIEPPDLSTDTLRLAEPPEVVQEEQINGSPDEAFEESGGGLDMPSAGAIGSMTGLKAVGPGARVPDAQGSAAMVPSGLDNEIGSGGKGKGFHGRGKGVRKAMVGGYGGTKASERAVGAALNWFARHQNADGSWALDRYTKGCQDGSCSGVGTLKSDNAATSLALLAYLGAGQTHKSKGPYRKAIFGGIASLLNSQKSDGDLRGPSGTMYVHALSTLVLCEAFGMSGDKQVGASAQRAIHFIERAQDPKGGGWRYQPGEPGDTSVAGWQMMALKSGVMANLAVNPQTIAGLDTFLKSVASGNNKGLFAYQAGTPPSPTMTSVGMLCTQYLGAQRNDPRLTEGVGNLLANLPDGNVRNSYYWYYGTLAMHNLPGPEWDLWNRRMRRILIDSQVRYGCAAGSWSPQGHSHCDPGGRILVTSLCTLTLEVYYRYLPLYKLANE